MYLVKSSIIRSKSYRGGLSIAAARHALSASVALVALAVAAPAVAQQVEWNGSVSSDWTDGGNWGGNAVPSATTNIIVNSNRDLAELGAIVSVAGQSVGAVTIGTETYGGDLQVTSAGRLNIGGPIVLGVGGTGNLSVNTGGQVTSDGLVTLGMENGVTGNLIVQGANSRFQHSGDVNVGSVGNGNVNVSNGGIFSSDGSFVVGQHGTVRVSGGSSFDAASILVGTGGQVLIGNPTATTAPSAANIVNVGVVDLNGLLQINQSFDQSTNNAFVNLDGTLTGTGSIFLASGGLNISGDASGFAGTIDLSGNGTLSNSSSADARLVLESNIGSAVTINGNVPSARKNNLALDGAGDTAVAAMIAGGWASFVKDGSGTTTLSGTNNFQVATAAGMSGGAIQINEGTLAIASDASLGAGTNTVSIGDAALATTADDSSARTITLQNASSAINVASGTSFGLTGTLTGAGALNVAGGGTLDITGLTNSTYDGGTNVAAGTLIGSTTTLQGDITNEGTVVFRQAALNGSFAGETNGSGTFVKDGVAELILAAESDTNWRVDGGQLSATAGQYAGNVNIAEGANFALTGGGTHTWSGSLAGAGDFNKDGASTLTLDGNNGVFTGTTTVGGGILNVASALGGNVNVAALAGLGGTGTIGGDVAVANTGSLIGLQGQSLNITGDVSLAANAVVDVTLGAPGKGNPRQGINDRLFNVGGDLDLNGTLQITNNTADAGGFRAGVYRIFDYAGQVTGSGLALDPANAGGADIDQLRVQTSVAGQVNLINTTGVAMHFWDGANGIKDDGAVQGGNGIWTTGGLDWAQSDYAMNGGWGQGGFAVFQGTGGLVNIDASAGIIASGMQFTADGYEIGGGALTLTEIEGGNYAQLDANDGVSATISAGLVGDALIDKGGAGTIILAGNNAGYAGDARVTDGTLLIDGNFGGTVAVGGTQANQNGTLGGVGDIAGSVTVQAGSTLLGNQSASAPLTMGELTLEQSSIVEVTLNAPENSTGLFLVNGDVNLNGGTLDVTAGTDFGRGVYRIIDYTGTRNGDGLAIGSGTGGYDYEVQLADAQKQINLVVGSNIAFWNGTVENPTSGITGGNGIWRADQRTNWTNSSGTVGHAWEQNLYAVFQGQPGTVTVDNSQGQISVDGMQFGVDGYVIGGDAIALNTDEGQTQIRVGDGSAAGAGFVAMIGSQLIGSTGMEKVDLGTLVLTADNTYTGGTTVTNGTLVLGNGGTSGSVQGNVIVADEGALVFNRSNDYTFSGVISGEGVVGQISSGTTTLTADSSAFEGTTRVINGGLHVTGSLGGLVTVENGGLLDGTGTIGDVVVLNGGTIGADTSGSIGNFNAGDLAFAGGSSYRVNVAANGTGDRIFSSGETVINGGLVDVRAGSGNYADQTRYTIITAQDGVTRGGPNSGFDDVRSNLVFLTPSLEYDANNVYLVVDRNDTSFCLPGSTRNQCATGEGAESTGPGNPIYDAIVNLSDPQARDVFDQLSGEIHASVQSGLIEDSRFVRDATGDRIRNAFGQSGASGKVLTYVPGKDIKNPTPQPVWVDADKADGLALWGHGFGSWGQIDGDGNAAQFERNVGGLFVGGDVPVFDTMRLGVVAGYSHSSYDVGARNSSGSSENFDLGIYGGGQWDAVGLSFGANYTWHNLETQRFVSFPGVTDSLSADYDAQTVQVYGDIGYTFDLGGVSFEPFAGLAYVNLDRDRFSERGGIAALTGYSTSTDTTFSTLGARFEKDFKLGEVDLTANGMLGWRHTLDAVTPTSTHAFTGGSPFTISGVPVAEDVAVIEAGISAKLNEKLSVGASYSGQFGSGFEDQGLRGNLNWKF